MADTRPFVLVAGATGNAGQSIVNGLLASGNFLIAAYVRPASASKPAVASLRASGVEIRLGELNDSAEKLKEVLAGVDILISAVDSRVILEQEHIIRAAKDVGVKRVVPCDYVWPAEKGVCAMIDTKLAIRELVKEIGVPHTFIDVGWWMQIALPFPTRSRAAPEVKTLTYEIHGAGDDRVLMTDVTHIGTYAARIIADPRTLNQAVIVWEDEITQLETHEIGERESGEAEALKAQRIYVTAEELQRRLVETKTNAAQKPDDAMVQMVFNWYQYMHSIHILQECTLENAKRKGYLDAHELYPDIPRYSVEDFAKEFYAQEDPGIY